MLIVRLLDSDDRGYCPMRLFGAIWHLFFFLGLALRARKIPLNAYTGVYSRILNHFTKLPQMDVFEPLNAAPRGPRPIYKKTPPLYAFSWSRMLTVFIFDWDPRGFDTVFNISRIKSTPIFIFLSVQLLRSVPDASIQATAINHVR